MESKLASRSEAMELVQQVDRPGQTREEVVENYDKWSKYDEHMAAMSYRGPGLAAEAILRHAPGDKNMHILDVGAGTGAVAQELKKAGLTNIDALDPSQGLLQIAKDKNLYKTFFNVSFTDKVDFIDTSTYDVVVSTGSMGEGHLLLNTFPEMIRCVKPGGLVILTISEEDLNNDCVCKDKMVPYMESLQAEGLWQQVEKTFLQDYTSEYPGFLFVLEITKTVDSGQ